jgi:hypothetical protein
MRMELGAVSVEVDGQAELDAFLRRILRALTNKEVGAFLGVTERTVRRWKLEGRLPGPRKGQVTVLELLQFLQAQGSAPGEARAQPRPRHLPRPVGRLPT